ncbi:MAG: hypothetical protein M3461_22405 [Pseudomonadota bacterium]|nr:hypothetical protein [Pseudomonadota bacterium]
MAELTHIERYLAQEENNVELRIIGRVSEVLLAQEDGTAKPHIELRLKAEVVTPNLATAFSDAHIRAMPYSGNHDRRPDGQIIQGFVRPFDRELEVAIAVPENAFLAFLAGVVISFIEWTTVNTMAVRGPRLLGQKLSAPPEASQAADGCPCFTLNIYIAP